MTCQLCRRQYTPRFPSKAAAMATTDKEGREQWLTEICSTACWDKLTLEPEDL